jgi:DNA modification methylase
VENLVEIFRDVKRVLKDDGTVWLNLGDSYVGTGHKGEHKDPKYSNGRNGQTTALNNKVDGLKSKDLIGIPWRVAFALQEDGWYLRQDIIWAKPNPMPESVKDRCTKSHEYIFLLSKKPKYFFDHVAMKEPATTKNGKPRQFGASNQVGTLRNDEGRVFEDTGLRNKRDVWFVSTKPYKGAHFAVYPTALIEPCVLAGSRPNDTVLDIFSGSGTTGVVALQNNRNYIGIEINKDYAELSEQRLTTEVGVFGSITVKSVEN